jgi:hypothetical protein
MSVCLRVCALLMLCIGFRLTSQACAGNTAITGGGLWIANSLFLALPPSVVEFTDNRASQGGAVNAAMSQLSVHANRSSFSGNTAEIKGGALNLINSTLEFRGNCTVLNSFAGEGGGGAVDVRIHRPFRGRGCDSLFPTKRCRPGGRRNLPPKRLVGPFQRQHHFRRLVNEAASSLPVTFTADAWHAPAISVQIAARVALCVGCAFEPTCKLLPRRQHSGGGRRGVRLGLAHHRPHGLHHHI